jgi:hypothetical protein
MTAEADNAARPNPMPECDVIMKGGITSGVVFPLAIYRLSKKFRFVNLGGTSAGGIGAAVAAAAEYNRDKGGFERIAKVPNELGENLLKLFQPSPSVRPLFDILIAATAKPEPGKFAMPKILTVLWAIIAGYPLAALIGAVIGAVTGYILFWPLANIGWARGIASLLIAVALGVIISLGLRLWKAAMSDLKDNDYGLCTGATQDEKAYGFRGVTEWLADTIDECAGLKVEQEPGGRPLTFGDLTKPPNGGKPIILRMMTTNLSMKRPYRLPFQTESEKLFAYRKEEFEQFFPKRVMDYLATVSPQFATKHGEAIEGYYHLPNSDDLPVIVATRMSLSFPVLFTIVPLYAVDYTLVENREKKSDSAADGTAKKKPTMSRCLFSDGGLSNNFPIQFFDNLWPNRPTFGIGLDEYTQERDTTYDSETHPQETRVWLPKNVQDGSLLPINKVDGLFAFLASIIFSAKDWQDNLQSAQQGYRERIVHVALKPDEGGLNLDMRSATIGLLSNYGAQAGDTLNQEFDLDDHRWRRFLIAMVRLESTLFELRHSYDGTQSPLTPATGGPPPELFEAFLRRYPPDTAHYKPVSADWLDEMRGRAEALVKMAENWDNKIKAHDGNYPTPETDLRITPRP